MLSPGDLVVMEPRADRVHGAPAEIEVRVVAYAEPNTLRAPDRTLRMEPEEPIRVVAADDSFLIRESLTVMLESEPDIELVDVCSDGRELEAAIAAKHPAVV